MNAVWFDPNLYAWIPGAALGILGGVYGTLVGMLAPQGKARGLVLGLHGLILVASVVLLVAGIVALAAGQPYGVWYGLGLAGLLGVVIFGTLLPVVLNAYRMAERRKMSAQDLPL
jgi:Flp pilus assembly protein TadB